MSDQVIKRWIVIQTPGYAPITKTPSGRTHAAALLMIEELLIYFPRSTMLLVELAYGNDLWVTDADTDGDGFPEEGLYNTIDQGSPAIQYAPDQVYLAMRQIEIGRAHV